MDPDLPVFVGNLQEMREVFFNLLLNAVQSIGDQKGKISIHVSHKEAENSIQVQIADTGSGIAEEHLDKLFNPFFTTRHGALGLGLFVTKQIVHRMGGSIRVESRLHEGSLFMVSLPCRTAEVGQPLGEFVKS